MKDKKLNPNTKPQTLTSNVAITLIALVITIIVMLILVGVSVSVAINGGLFSTAKKATAETQYQEDREMLFSAIIGSFNNSAEVDFEKLDANLPEGFTVSEGLYTSKAGNKFCVNQSGNILTPPEVTVDGKTVALTPNNVGDYLGKVVTNYKKNYDTSITEAIEIGTQTYTVSTKYRLYYVDFDNKYKDGEGTIYLKAEYFYDGGIVQTTEPAKDDVVKIKELNPALYANGVTPPDENNDNIKGIKWLTNTKNWEALKSNISDEISLDDINYIVGAPSLEMMIDSYNKHYGLTGDEPDVTTDLEGTDARVKLFYKYDNKYGYEIGPATDAYYGEYSRHYSVKSDQEIDPMYYQTGYVWLASPQRNSRYLTCFNPTDGGYVGHIGTVTTNGEPDIHGSRQFCPLVSLKSSVNLKLQ